MPELNHRIVGRIVWQHGSGDTLILPQGWADANIVTVHVPALAGVELYDGSRFDGGVEWYRAGVEQLLGAWAEVQQRGLAKYLLTFDGSFTPRMVRGSSTTPSNHSFGTALDINAAWNPIGHAPGSGKGTVVPLVPIFKAWGFAWGGDYKHRLDPMHFEMAELRPPAPKLLLSGKDTGVEVVLRDGTAYAPARALAEVLGLAVGFDPVRKNVTLSRPGGLAVPVTTWMRVGSGWVSVRDAARVARVSLVWDQRQNEALMAR